VNAQSPSVATLEFHGISVEDPERWLNVLESPDARKWVAEQDSRARDFLVRQTRIGYCREFMGRNHIVVDPPWEAVRGEFTFFLSRRSAGDHLSVCLRDSHGGERVLIGPDEDGQMLNAESVAVSPTGRFIAYATSPPGDILVTPKLYDRAAGKVLETACRSTALPMIAWHPEEGGYYYSVCRRLFRPEEASRDGIYWHAIGSDGHADVCIKPYADGPGHLAFAVVVGDGAYLLLFTYQFSSGRSGVSLCRTDETWPGSPVAAESIPLFEDLECINHFFGEGRGRLYFQTTLDAPMGRIVAIDPLRPARDSWDTVINEDKLAIARPSRFPGPSKCAVAEDTLFVTYVEHAHDVLLHFDASGRLRRKVELPVASTIDAVIRDGDHFRVYAQSFLEPRTVYIYRGAAAGDTLLLTARTAMPDIDLELYEVRQVFYPAKDGVPIPMYLLHRKGIRRDGSHAVLLYGYGGFGQSISPEYMADAALWLQLGGVYALANIRGGGEYGEPWHAAGSREHKQTSFDDFYAAAEYLISQRYTEPRRLAIKGVSNGGLLTGVCVNQRPELFAAVVTEIPLTDMLTLGRTATGRAVTAEYGNPDDSRDMFEVLRGYSPLHNVREDDSGVPQWVVVAEKDSAAPPEQGCRFVAARQAKLRAAGRDGCVFLRMLRDVAHTGWAPEVAGAVMAEEMAFLHHFAAIT
jgi:prolyl oligopeptidase